MGISMTAAPACRFCGFASGRTESESDKPIARTADYFVVPSIGALVPGWILICTKEHRTNFAGKYGDKQLTALRLEMARALSEKFRLPVRMFEHGAVGTGTRTGCGVDHAHIHLVATGADLLEYAPTNAVLTWQDASVSLIDHRAGDREYLFYAADALAENPAGQIAFPVHPTSQFFRRAIAVAVNRADEYDYRSHPYIENTVATSKALSTI